MLPSSWKAFRKDWTVSILRFAGTGLHQSRRFEAACFSWKDCSTACISLRSASLCRIIISMDIRSGGVACWAVFARLRDLGCPKKDSYSRFAPLDVEPPPLDADGVSPATVFSLQLVGGVLFLVPAVVSSPLVGGGVLPPAPTSLSAADILSPPARVAFALAAAAALLPVWPDSHHFEVLFSSAAAD
ncbi:hypothetical protein FOBRF1_006873 [Fusarium oxysporum]